MATWEEIEERENNQPTWLESLAEMSVTWDNQSQTWELHDAVTGEIFTVPTQRAGNQLRWTALLHERIPYDFYAVRSDQRNVWTDTYGCDDNRCVCCDSALHAIDPENICMDCVDMGCNINN